LYAYGGFAAVLLIALVLRHWLWARSGTKGKRQR
jgi:hypothetical protein